MTISEAAAARRLAYDRVVGELQKIDPKAIPITKPTDVYAIERVAEQARQAVPPEPLPESSEVRLLSRCSAMQGSCAELVGAARRLGIKVELPKISDTDPFAQLQALNEFHDLLEKQITYVNETTKEQRAIDQLRRQVHKLEARMGALGSALSSLNELLPHLMPGRHDDQDTLKTNNNSEPGKK